MTCDLTQTRVTGVWGNDCALSMGPDGKPVLLEGQGYKVSRTNSAIVLLCRCQKQDEGMRANRVAWLVCSLT